MKKKMLSFTLAQTEEIKMYGLSDLAKKYWNDLPTVTDRLGGKVIKITGMLNGDTLDDLYMAGEMAPARANPMTPVSSGHSGQTSGSGWIFRERMRRITQLKHGRFYAAHIAGHEIAVSFHRNST